jgi:pimeloyl-ACP methyl ester carboxylesterase
MNREALELARRMVLMQADVGMTDTEACPVCRETGGTPRALTPCGHSFHAECLLSHFEQVGLWCPVCRYECTREDEWRRNTSMVTILNRSEEDVSSHQNEGRVRRVRRTSERRGRERRASTSRQESEIESGAEGRAGRGGHEQRPVVMWIHGFRPQECRDEILFPDDTSEDPTFRFLPTLFRRGVTIRYRCYGDFYEASRRVANMMRRAHEELSPDGRCPVVVVGHSMGALVAASGLACLVQEGVCPPLSTIVAVDSPWWGIRFGSNSAPSSLAAAPSDAGEDAASGESRGSSMGTLHLAISEVAKVAGVDGVGPFASWVSGAVLGESFGNIVDGGMQTLQFLRPLLVRDVSAPPPFHGRYGGTILYHPREAARYLQDRGCTITNIQSNFDTATIDFCPPPRPSGVQAHGGDHTEDYGGTLESLLGMIARAQEHRTWFEGERGEYIASVLSSNFGCIPRN